MKCMEILPRNEMRGEINKCYITKVGIHILQEFYYKLSKFEKKKLLNIIKQPEIYYFLVATPCAALHRNPL